MSDNRFCTRCEKAAAADDAFCSRCGAAIFYKNGAAKTAINVGLSKKLAPATLVATRAALLFDKLSKSALGWGVLIGVGVLLVVFAITVPYFSRPSNVEEALSEKTASSAQPISEDTSDTSINGSLIADNKFKYVGKKVDLRCIVNSVSRMFFNADCGEKHKPALLIIQYEARGLSKGQAVRVFGVVQPPMESSDVMGAVMQFPSVKADFVK